MSDPPFVMSKYMNQLDLYKDKAKYYQDLSDEFSLRNALLENALRDLINDCINFNGSELSDCILKQSVDMLNLAKKG